MRAELLHILQHSRGLDKYGQGRRYRNHFVAGGKDIARCRELVAMGYMEERPASELTGGSPWFLVTGAGDQAIDQFSPEPPPPPVLTKAQRNYQDFLDADGCTGTFAEHLGIARPAVESEMQWLDGHLKDGQWISGRHEWRYRYRRITRNGYWGQDVVAGKWSPTKKEAKASYKAALQAQRRRIAA
ncbi:hypothetical protein [Chromobacterium phragmitis]|uniref:hypothetical protein n=1 Tax=Chromobacterium phragmitis TaxID=2202141 RepID=UPI0019152511|nr:hypothetical protein [Chromobacterium phragmitis]